MNAVCNGYLLDESKGDFIAEDGRKVSYHKARFYNLDEAKIFKASVTDSSDALPEPQVHCLLSFDVVAGEKFCKLNYDGFQLSDA